MMDNRFFYLSTCSTCKRILKELNLPESVHKQDIKTSPLDSKTWAALADLAGSYEALFSKRAQLYKQRNLGEKHLEERDYQQLLKEHYTFLKRPVLVLNDQVFIGSSPATIAQAQKTLEKL